MSRLRRFAASASQVRLAVILAMLCAPATAGAQTYTGTAGPHAGAFELSGGMVWTAGYTAGSGDATETANSTTSAPPLTLFAASSRVPAVVGVEGRAGIYVSTRISVEGVFQFSRPSLRTSLGSDFENATPVEAVGGLSSYLAAGSLVFHLGDGRLVPFVLGGAGYLRQIDEDNAEALTGNEVHGGGGVKLWFGPAPGHLGMRVDAIASVRSKSAGFESKRRALPVLSAGLVYLF